MGYSESLKGKKLLILGATANEIPLVKRAQEFGVYVITTDYNTDLEKSPAKKISDEYWNVSWSDIDQLAELCKKNCVSGITAGFSEIRVDNLISLCQRLGLPCYIEPSQLAITRDKALFKKVCRKNGVPTIKEYESIEAVDAYPVIVKPTDRAGSIGVGIAYNNDELKKAYDVAMEKSLTKSVIIEEYVTDAFEFDVHYAVMDGKVMLLTTDDIIAAKGNQKDGKVVQSAWMYPSKFHNAYVDHASKNIEKMINDMKIKNGTIFFSGFAKEDGSISFFECGYRLWGEQEFNYDWLCGKMNYLDIYIFHALLGSCAEVEKNKDGDKDLKGVALNLYVTDGIISKMEGFDRLSENPDCVLNIIDSYIGQECNFENAILTKAGLIGFANKDPKKLQSDIENAYSFLLIQNEKEKNILYDYIDTKYIGSWWNTTNKKRTSE